MKKTVAYIVSMIVLAMNFAFTHPKLTAMTGLTVCSSKNACAQFSNSYNATTNVVSLTGAWSGLYLEDRKDSITTNSYVRFNESSFQVRSWSNYFTYVLNPNVILTDANGISGPYPLSSLTFSYSQITGTPAAVKRSIALTGVTNSSGIVTFTFTPFVAPPIDVYAGGFGTLNKETIVPNSAATTTSAVYLVQVRNDVLGLLPTYSVVPSRSVNVTFTER